MNPLTLALMLFASVPAAGQGGTAYCNCYCGVQLRPPCGDEACKRACGYNPGGAAAPSGGGYSPGQAAVMGAAAGLSGAISGAISNWISGNPAQEAARREAARIQAEYEAEQRRIAEEAERKRFEAEKKELIRGFKGMPAGALQLKGAPDTGMLKLKDSSPKKAPAPDSAEKSRRKAFDCALAEVYLYAEVLGEGGRLLTKELEAEARRMSAELRSAGPGTMVVGGVDGMSQGAKVGGQLLVKIVANRGESGGSFKVDVLGSITGPDGKGKEVQNLILLDAAGKVLHKNLSPSAEACLKRAGLEQPNDTP